MNRPDTKYRMMWGGAWRPVTYMIGQGKDQTHNVLHATRAVLFVSEDTWIATTVNPGDIIERFDRDPDARNWVPVTDPEPLTVRKLGY